MVIKILGTGCAKCHTLEVNAKKAVAETGIAAAIEKVTGLSAIMAFGVMVTPALVIDDVVKSAGRVLSPSEIMRYIKEQGALPRLRSATEAPCSHNDKE
ncbi:MAG: thioredoxin family protein [Spirochaetota bacterium]